MKSYNLIYQPQKWRINEFINKGKNIDHPEESRPIHILENVNMNTIRKWISDNKDKCLSFRIINTKTNEEEITFNVWEGITYKGQLLTV
jgi:hypothetical protein